MATKMRERRNRIRKGRRDRRSRRRSGPEKTYFGGTEEAQQEYRERFQGQDEEARAAGMQAVDAFGRTRDDIANTRGFVGSDYFTARNVTPGARQAATESAAGITGQAALGLMDRKAALAQNNLATAGNKSIAMRSGSLADANAQLGQALSQADISGATDQAIQQNAQLAQQQLAANIGQQQRAAIGAAASQGESGALAMQAALAGAAQGGAQMAGQSNLAQQQLAADMRYQAALQRSQDQLSVGAQQAQNVMGAGDANAQAYMAARAAQAQNALGVADANAQQRQSAQAQQAQAQGSLYGQALGAQQATQGAYMAGTQMATDQAAQYAGMQVGQQQGARQSLLGMEGTAAGIDQTNAQAAYQSAVEHQGRLIKGTTLGLAG